MKIASAVIAALALALPSAACAPEPHVADRPEILWRLVVEKEDQPYIADRHMSLVDCMSIADTIESVEPFYTGADVVYCEQKA